MGRKIDRTGNLVEVSALRCAVVALLDGTPLVVVALDVARALGGPGPAALSLFEVWGSRTDLQVSADSTVPLTLATTDVRVSAERLPYGGRLTPVLLMVSPHDVGAVPLIVEAHDLRRGAKS